MCVFPGRSFVKVCFPGAAVMNSSRVVGERSRLFFFVLIPGVWHTAVYSSSLFNVSRAAFEIEGD